MKRGFNILLAGIIILLVGGVILGSILYRPVMMKIYASRLESGDPATARAAFEYLMKSGENGKKIIGAFVRKRRKSGWGEKMCGFRMKIKTDYPVVSIEDIETEKDVMKRPEGFLLLKLQGPDPVDLWSGSGFNFKMVINWRSIFSRKKDGDAFTYKDTIGVETTRCRPGTILHEGGFPLVVKKIKPGIYEVGISVAVEFAMPVKGKPNRLCVYTGKDAKKVYSNKIIYAVVP